ncbi:MAG: hypothetical protein IID03_05100 [Candidatus Dadabacteria bacterium]|nr:hypothetical protein [Candidatus Dadabacteria bacterium]
MFKIGDKFVLKLPIIGKKNQFNEGLIGEITKIFQRESDAAYRVQFSDGRIAVLPQNIITETSSPFEE